LISEDSITSHAHSMNTNKANDKQIRAPSKDVAPSAMTRTYWAMPVRCPVTSPPISRSSPGKQRDGAYPPLVAWQHALSNSWWKTTGGSFGALVVRDFDGASDVFSLSEAFSSPDDSVYASRSRLRLLSVVIDALWMLSPPRLSSSAFRGRVNNTQDQSNTRYVPSFSFIPLAVETRAASVIPVLPCIAFLTSYLDFESEP
jgi:hypothetical protein